MSDLQKEPSGRHVSNLQPWNAFLVPRLCLCCGHKGEAGDFLLSSLFKPPVSGLCQPSRVRTFPAPQETAGLGLDA